MRELRSRLWIVLKGLIFALVAAASGVLLLLRSPTWQTTALIVTLTWASCRFYYFLFYVLEKYVDPRFRYSGLMGLLLVLLRPGNAHAK